MEPSQLLLFLPSLFPAPLVPVPACPLWPLHIRAQTPKWKFFTVLFCFLVPVEALELPRPVDLVCCVPGLAASFRATCAESLSRVPTRCDPHGL